MTGLDDTIARMNAARYVEVRCTVMPPRERSVRIVLVGGARSEILPLSSIHPQDAAAIKSAGQTHERTLRVNTDMAKAKNLTTTHNPAAASSDLLGEKR